MLTPNVAFYRALEVENGPKLMPNMHIFAVEATTGIHEDGLPRHDAFP